MKVKYYKILFNTKPTLLEQEINEHLRNGYELHGSFKVCPEGLHNPIWFYQAVILNEENNIIKELEG